MQYKNYTNEDIIKHSKTAKSLGQLIESLGLVKAGGNYKTIGKKVEELHIDTSKWRNKKFNKGVKFKDYPEYKRNTHLKKRLIEERGHKCEICELSTWLNKPIPIELHHINGISIDNNITNLQLLCPNCHSMTNNFRNRK